MTKIKHAERAHSKLGASSADRWINCPGSVRLSEKCPKPKDSDYAAEGTFAHELCEHVLKEKISREDLKNITHFKGKIIPKEMFDHVFLYVDHVRALRKEIGPGADYLMEQKFHLKHIHEDLFGTSDFTIREEFGRLIVIDFKYGAGVTVEAEDNTQMIQYALGAHERFDKEYGFTHVRLTIIQPRAFHQSGEVVRSWDIPVKELLKWKPLFKAAALKALEPNPGFKAGSHCYWCPAKIVCPEISKKALAQAQIDFDMVDDVVTPIPVLELLSPKEMGKILRGLQMVDMWAKAVREYAEEELNKGVKIPGFKLVGKQSRRQWTDEKKAAAEAKKKFGEKAFSEPSLLSPAQLEKAIGDKDWVAKRVSDISTGTTMVPDSDKRIAITPAKSDFK